MHSLQGGEYRLSPAMSLLQIVDVVARGQVLLHAVTIPEGFTAAEVVDVLVDKGLGDREPLTTVVRHGADLYTFSFLDGAVGGSLEGFLLPDTYQIPRGLSARDVVGVFLGRFGQVVVPRWEARGGSGSLREIITLASLVEREARLPEERALIAGVLSNRLHRRMLLEVDATVLYALGRHKSVVTYKDLDVTSPYNTYRHIGLPPGPIANPGMAAIEAALTPAVTDYLYYVARADGSHVFSLTYEEHLAPVKPIPWAFRRAMTIMGIPARQTALIGDQLFTDILGGNLVGMYTILVDPLSSQEFPTTKLVRRLERLVRARVIDRIQAR